MDIEIHDEQLVIDGTAFPLNNMKILREVGSGANATCFDVINQMLDRREVIKIWVPREGDTEVSREKFLNEVRKNSRFEHQRIARIYEADIKNGVYFCRMQFVEGVTLKEYLKIYRDLIFRYNIMDSILATMRQVYENGYYHGDLHGGNVIITPELEPVIIDFGTSAFSGVAKSHKRDAEMLYQLCRKTLPEIREYNYLDKSIIRMGSKCLCGLLQASLSILWALRNVESADEYGKLNDIIFPAEIILHEYPEVDRGKMRSFLEKKVPDYQDITSRVSLALKS